MPIRPTILVRARESTTRQTTVGRDSSRHGFTGRAALRRQGEQRTYVPNHCTHRGRKPALAVRMCGCPCCAREIILAVISLVTSPSVSEWAQPHVQEAQTATRGCSPIMVVGDRAFPCWRTSRSTARLCGARKGVLPTTTGLLASGHGESYRDRSPTIRHHPGNRVGGMLRKFTMHLRCVQPRRKERYIRCHVLHMCSQARTE